MKNKLLLVAGVVIILLLVVFSSCSNTTESKQPVNVSLGGQQTGLWVSGEGRVSMAPDVATVTLGVSAQTTTVAEAQSQAATAMDKIIATLKSNGVADKDVQTQNFSITQVVRFDDKTEQNIILGYNVSNTVVAKLRDISRAGATIDAVVSAGGDYTRFNGISFSIDKPDYTQARELAMTDAKAKADQMAKLAGANLGPATYISESTYVPGPPPIYFKSADMVSAAPVPTTSISPGEMDIVVNVQVAYSIK